jgi:hypothetical protein
MLDSPNRTPKPRVRRSVGELFGQPEVIRAAARLGYLSQVVKNRLSDNVGGVKHFSRTLRRALGEERHFALVDGFAFSNPGSLVISQVGNSVRPMHLFGRQRPIMITYFELLREEERDANPVLKRCATQIKFGPVARFSGSNLSDIIRIASRASLIFRTAGARPSG